MVVPDLGARIGGGLAVDFIGNIALRLGSVAVSIAVARMLTTTEWGAVSLALAAYGITEVLTDPSLAAAINRSPEVTDELVDVAWTLGLIRGFCVAVLLCVGAPIIARAIGHHEITSYLRVLAFGMFTSSLVNLHVVRYTRELKFARMQLLDLFKALSSTSISLILLLVGIGPMSLAIGPVAGNFVHAATTWIIVSPRPRIRFSREKQREILAFARWMMTGNIAIYLFYTLDSIYIGRYLGLAAVGAYAFAGRVVSTVMTLLTRPMHKMLFATFASVQADNHRVVAVARSALTLAACAGTLMGGILLVCAGDLFVVLGGGPAWSAAVPISQALMVSALTQVLFTVLSPMLQAVGETKTVATIMMVQLMLLAPALVIGSALGGVIGVAVGVSCASALRTTLTFFLVARRFPFGVIAQVSAIVPAVLIGGAVASLGMLLVRIPLPAFLRLSVVAFTMAASYFALWEFARRWAGFRTWPALAEPVFNSALSLLKRISENRRPQSLVDR